MITHEAQFCVCAARGMQLLVLSTDRFATYQCNGKVTAAYHTGDVV